MNGLNSWIIDAYRTILSGENEIVLKTSPQIFRCERSWRWVPAPLPDYDLWCVLAGTGVLRIDGASHALRAGVCFVFPPGAQPYGTHDPADPLSVFAVHFETVGRADIPTKTYVNSTSGVAFLTVLAERSEQVAGSGSDLGRRVAKSLVRETMLHLLYESEQPSQAIDALVSDLCTSIIRQPGEAWTVDVMAERASLSRSQLTRRMRARRGVSPMEFVIRTRMERARQLLAETPMTITEVAEALGFESVFYCSRLFKQRFGVSPKGYRDSVRC